MREIFQGKEVDLVTQQSFESLKIPLIDLWFSGWESSIWKQRASPKSSTGLLVLSVFLSNTYLTMFFIVTGWARSSVTVNWRKRSAADVQQLEMCCSVTSANLILFFRTSIKKTQNSQQLSVFRRLRRVLQAECNFREQADSFLFLPLFRNSNNQLSSIVS